MYFIKPKTVFFFFLLDKVIHLHAPYWVILFGGEIWDLPGWITGSSYPLEEVSAQNMKQKSTPFLLWASCKYTLETQYFSFSRVQPQHQAPPGMYFHQHLIAVTATAKKNTASLALRSHTLLLPAPFTLVSKADPG